MQQPEAGVGGPVELRDAAGRVTNEATRRCFNTLIDAFAVWIETSASA